MKTRKTCQAALDEVLAQKKARSTNWNGHIMTKPISAIEQGLPQSPVVLPDALRHLASWTEAKIDEDLTTRVARDWIDDHQCRDTHGLDQLGSHTSTTWRWTE